MVFILSSICFTNAHTATLETLKEECRKSKGEACQTLKIGIAHRELGHSDKAKACFSGNFLAKVANAGA